MRSLQFIREVVNYFNQNHSTVRETAKHFGISKSSVYYYLTVISPNAESAEILMKNKNERHLRGGIATKNKYLRQKNVKNFAKQNFTRNS